MFTITVSIQYWFGEIIELFVWSLI